MLLSISEMTSDIKTVYSTWLGGNSLKLNCNYDGCKKARWWFLMMIAQGNGNAVRCGMAWRRICCFMFFLQILVLLLIYCIS